MSASRSTSTNCRRHTKVANGVFGMPTLWITNSTCCLCLMLRWIVMFSLETKSTTLQFAASSVQSTNGAVDDQGFLIKSQLPHQQKTTINTRSGFVRPCWEMYSQMLLNSLSDEQPEHLFRGQTWQKQEWPRPHVAREFSVPPLAGRIRWSLTFAANARDRAREMQSRISKFPRRMSS